jgi:hypothetical protein
MSKLPPPVEVQEQPQQLPDYVLWRDPESTVIHKVNLPQYQIAGLPLKRVQDPQGFTAFMASKVGKDYRIKAREAYNTALATPAPEKKQPPAKCGDKLVTCNLCNDSHLLSVEPIAVDGYLHHHNVSCKCRINPINGVMTFAQAKAKGLRLYKLDPLSFGFGVDNQVN